MTLPRNIIIPAILERYLKIINFVVCLLRRRIRTDCNQKSMTYHEGILENNETLRLAL